MTGKPFITLEENLTKVVTARFSRQEYAELEAIAQRESRKVAAVVRLLTREGLKARKKVR